MNQLNLRLRPFSKTLCVTGYLFLISAHFIFNNAVAHSHLVDKASDVGHSKIKNKLGQVIATQINANNVEAYQRKGPDAIGGIGDWFFSNGTLCAVISNVNHESEFSTKGGSLIDLGFCGREDDHFSFTHDLVNGTREKVLDAESVEIDHQSNSILVNSQTNGVHLLTRYHFDSDKPLELHISKTYSKTYSKKKGDDFNFVSPLNFNLRSLEPFIFSSKKPNNSSGFQNEDFVKRGIGAINKAARKADTIILPSPKHAAEPISYGWHLKSAQRVEHTETFDVPFFMLADTESTAMMVLTDTFYVGDNDDIGWMQLVQIPMLELSDSATLQTEEIIYVGKSGDVASVVNQFFPQGQIIHGRLDTPDSALHIRQANGAPITHVRPDQDGKFSFRLPEGEYTLTALAYGDREFTTSFKSKGRNPLNLGTLDLPPAAKIKLPQNQAMRLVFVGLDGTPTPDLASELSQASIAFDDHIEYRKPTNSVFLAGINSDRKSLDIAPGKYRVYATRGPEYSLEIREISVERGAELNLDINIPTRAVKTPNYIASDLHVHSGLSFDNAFVESERVRSFVAEHGEVMVSSEHDLPTDFNPYIQAMGVQNKIVSIPAVEATSILPTERNPYTGGHANVFPFKPKPTHYRNGMIAHEDKRLRDLIYAVRQRGENSVVQLNHPRHNAKLAGQELPDDWQDYVDHGNYLDHMGSAGHPYNAHHPLTHGHNKALIEKDPSTGIRDLDFDLIEILNPGGDDPKGRIAAVRRDWLSFLKQGEKVVGTANSDSHTALEQVALPRTMVKVSQDDVESFDQQEFVQNLKSGNAFGTTGPMLEISLGEASMGETFKGIRGTLTVDINAAEWITINELHVQSNGETVATFPLEDTSDQTIQIPLEFSQDSFVTVEVFGSADEHYRHVYPGLEPYAFSNPIYVDFDQNDKWVAPGL